MDLEIRLQSHFSGARFQLTPAFESDVLSNARRTAPPPGVGWKPTIPRSWRRALLVCACAILATGLVVTAMPAAAGPELPGWVMGVRSVVHIDSGGDGAATSWGTTVNVIGAYL